METPAERYRRLREAFADVVAAVPDDRWDAQSPCEDWTALDVVKHVIETEGMFLGFIGLEPADVGDVASDPLGAFRAATDRVQSALDDPATAEATYTGMGGTPSTFADGVDRFLSTDLIVHRWDLARATGGDDSVDPVDVAAVDAAMQQFPEEAMRGPGAFGPAVEPPEDADDWQRVLAYMGRRP